MKYLFWILLFFSLYAYVGYPLLLALLSRLISRPVRVGENIPFVSVVIAASNEERTIEKRLENLLAQDYPPDRYEIIVVSDGSTDGTNETVAAYAERNVQLIRLAKRGGKAVALNQGVARAVGEIIVFADARQTFASDALRRLAANFSDPAVGCVSGELMFLDDAGSGIQAEMGAYWRYEKAIRKLESASGSVVGATGAIYAIRKGLYRPLPAGTILDDVLTPMNIALQGYRVLFDGTATAYDVMSKDIDQEWTRKVRTLAGNWQLLSLAPSLVIPWRCPLWWRFLSHKIFRLLVAFALPCMLMASMVLEVPVYRAALVVQLFFYVIALAGFVIPGLRKLRPVNVAYFFLVMNLAVLAGFWRWITGRCATSWQPAYMK
jgi:poly-beta-1,6-N-acetyl-D-glucosamine synthase